MEVVFTTDPVSTIAGDLLAVCVSSDYKTDLKDLDDKFEGHLTAHLELADFKGKEGNKANLPTFGKTIHYFCSLLSIRLKTESIASK